MKKQTITTKIVLRVAFFIIVIGGISSYGIYTFTSHSLIEKEIEKVYIKAHDIELKAEGAFNTSMSEMEYLSKKDRVIELINSPTELAIRHVEGYVDTINYNSKYSAIFVMDTTGLTIFSSDPTFYGNNYGFRKYFIDAMDGKPTVYSAIGATSNALGYYVAQPIYEDDEIVGVLVGKIVPTTIGKILKGIEEDETVKFKMIDNNSVVIATCDLTLQFKTIDVLSNDAREEIADYRQYEERPLYQIKYPVEFSMLQNEYPNEVINIGEVTGDSQYNNELIYFAPIDGTPFSLIIESELTTIYEEVGEIAFQLGMFNAFTVIFTLSIVALILSRELKVIKSVAFTAEKIAHGRYKERFDENVTGEIAILISAIRKMADGFIKQQREQDDIINSQTAKLETKVNQLEKLNRAMIGREMKMLELKGEIQDLQSMIKKDEEN